jgi:beta-lactamase superfamily II metal-dependent hydrolase
MTLLPFLQQQGINRIDAEITLMSPNLEGLAALCDQIPITQVYSLIGLDTGLQAQLQQRGIPLETMKADQISRLGNLQWQIIAGGATLQMGRQSWMFWTQGEVDKLPQDGILWWSGRNLKIRQPQLRKLKGAIAYGRRVHPNLTQALHRQKVPFYWLDQSGAVRWTPEQGFIPTRDLGEAETARL